QDVGLIWVQVKTFSQTGFSLRVLLSRIKKVTKVRPAFRIVRVMLNDFAIRRNSFVGSPSLLQRVSVVLKNVRRVRFEFERLLEIREGLCPSLLSHQRRPCVVERIHILWIER